jgi:hypothetical protein
MSGRACAHAGYSASLEPKHSVRRHLRRIRARQHGRIAKHRVDGWNADLNRWERLVLSASTLLLA